MEPADYKDLNVANVKVICEPAKGVIFHSDHPCKVRFIPNQKPHFDEVLGVVLASENQYAERIC